MAIQSMETIAGIAIPDTPLVGEVTEFIRDAEDDVLFDHSRRVVLFVVLQGRRRGLQPDLELLYVGAMFHGLGLTRRYRSSTLRFEADSANAAREFLLQRVWTRPTPARCGIALHTTPGLPEFFQPEIALVTAGVETDVLGIGRDDVSPEALAEVTAAHPRTNFKQRILATFNDGMKHRPHSTFGTVNADVLQHFDATFVRDDFVEHHPQQHLARIAVPINDSTVCNVARRAYPHAHERQQITMTPPKGRGAVDAFGPIVEFMPPKDYEQVCVMRAVIPPGITVPLHSHNDFEDFHILAGSHQVLVESDGRPEWRDAHVGDYLRVPGGVPHAHRNISEEPAVDLSITTARMGSFFREVGRPAGSPPPTRQEVARFAEIAGRYGYWLATPEENAGFGITSPAFTA